MADIKGKMREHRLQWFSHVMRRVENGLIRTILEFQVRGRQCRDRPKLTWEQMMKTYIAAFWIDETLIEVGSVWKAENCQHDHVSGVIRA